MKIIIVFLCLIIGKNEAAEFKVNKEICNLIYETNIAIRKKFKVNDDNKTKKFYKEELKRLKKRTDECWKKGYKLDRK